MNKGREIQVVQHILYANSGSATEHEESDEGVDDELSPSGPVAMVARGNERYVPELYGPPCQSHLTPSYALSHRSPDPTTQIVLDVLNGIAYGFLSSTADSSLTSVTVRAFQILTGVPVVELKFELHVVGCSWLCSNSLRSVVDLFILRSSFGSCFAVFFYGLTDLSCVPPLFCP